MPKNANSVPRGKRMAYRKRQAAKQADYPTSVRIPDDILKVLRAEAEEQRRSTSWVIVEILRQWHAHVTAKKKHAPRAEKAS